jgi:plasmid stabilization system protein ParE
VAYAVSITVRAERDLAAIYDHIHAAESAAARRWFQALRRAILTLQENPNRCALTPESKKIRHLFYGNRLRIYRVIYLVTDDQKRVYVLHIRHGARRRFRIRDIL